MNELKQMVERGEISLRAAAYRLFYDGLFNYIPNDREVINKLHIFI